MPSTMRQTPRRAPKMKPTTIAKHGRKGTTQEPRLVTQYAIAVRAHELYKSSGCLAGRDLEFWLEAERQLRAELNV